MAARSALRRSLAAAGGEDEMKTKRAESSRTVRLFATPAEWTAWLEKNHHQSDGLWLRLAKKGLVAVGNVRRSAGDCFLLRMDRWTEARRKRTGVAAEISSPIGEKYLVEDQSGKSVGADRERANEACRVWKRSRVQRETEGGKRLTIRQRRQRCRTICRRR